MSYQYSNQYRKLLDCIKEDIAEDEMEFDYRVDDRGIVIEKYFGNKTNLTIPSSIEEAPVYKIGDEAFCEDEQVKKITLPNTIRIIGNRAFAESSLESVNLPNSLLIIGNQAFANSSLKSVNMPDFVSIIGDEAFFGTEINSIIIPRLTKIGAGAFSCTKIKTVKIPSEVSEEMFCNCNDLHTVIIEGAEIIGESAFDGCKKLKNVSLPDKLKEINRRAFSGTSIEYLIIPQSVECIGGENFPDDSHIAILSDDTKFCLDDHDYSLVTLYCNPSNINAKKIAKEYGMVRKSLSTFAKGSADYYKSFDWLEWDSTSENESKKVFGEQSYCKTECEFYEMCLANRETCVKNAYEQALKTLTPREERVVRLIYGIEEHKESVQLVAFAFRITEERIKQILGKALKKMRHPARFKKFISNEIGLVLFSACETPYSLLYRDIYYYGSESHEKCYQFYVEKKEAKDNFARYKKEQQSKIDLSTTFNDCCFGNRKGGIVTEGEITIGELQLKCGNEVFEFCEYNKTLFEEVVTVLHSKQIFLADYPPVGTLKSYFDKIYSNCAYAMSIEELDLSVRSFNCLKRAGIETVGDLTRSFEDIVRIRNLSENSLEEIIQKLESLGVSLRVDEE